MIKKIEKSIINKEFENLCEDLVIQAKMFSFLSPDNCEEWSGMLIDSSIDSGDLKTEYDRSNIHRLLRDKEYAQSQFYQSYINYFILRLTSVLELYLKDSIKQYMKLNTDLFVKGLKINRSIEDKDKFISGKKLKVFLLEYNKEVYVDILNQIARQYSKGNLWISKFKHYTNFLEVEITSEMNGYCKVLDLLFKMRNDITYLNRHLDEKAKPVLKIKDGFVFDRETKLNESSYRKVLEYLIEVTNSSQKMLRESHSQVYTKWSMNPLKITEVYKEVVDKYRE